MTRLAHPITLAAAAAAFFSITAAPHTAAKTLFTAIHTTFIELTYTMYSFQTFAIIS